MDQEKAVQLLRRGEEGAVEWNTYRKKNPAWNPELQGADLSGADLRRANLIFANLKGANLSESRLFEADLRDAFLQDANLSNASLSCVDFRHARLNSADLSGAVLGNAIFQQTQMDATNLGGAVCSGTIFSALDLSNAIGLGTTNHSTPSPLSIDTLYLSKGEIPESFLRGCGVPDTMITFSKSLVTQPFDFYSVFISYNHDDKEFAKRLYDTLQGRGVRCWLDEHQILPGDNIHDRIDEGIKLWDKVVLCASKNSLTSGWVDGEIGRALAKERQLMKDRGEKVYALIALNLDDYLFSEEYQRGWKTEVLDRMSPDFTDWKTNHDNFEAQVGLLLKALQTGDAGREAPPVPKI